jgi:isopentenyl phosphate kinase
MSLQPPIFLKLGGSLITDKRQPETPRLAVIERLAQEIAHARQTNPALRLVIGHGSGSYGHLYGQRYGTRRGVHTPEEWYGFAATGDAAARLNRVITGALLAVGIPAWSIQPSVALRCADGQVLAGPAETVQAALARGLVPVIFGDVALDRVRGGTIVSTEELFEALLPTLRPQRLVLAGEIDGVYTADPHLDPQAQRVPLITPATISALHQALGGSHGVDVTGGMAAKVAQSLAMIASQPGLQILICSGLQPGHVEQALLDQTVLIGTRLAGEAS